MKKMEISQMVNLEGGSNRQCLIDGILTGLFIGAIVATGGTAWPAWAAFGGGVSAANGNGCFG